MNGEYKISIPLAELMPLIAEQLESGQTVELTVRGVSMQPFLADGRDKIYMVSPKGREPRVGDLYMFRRSGGSYAMHRLCAIAPDGTLSFVGDGQLYPESGIAPDMLAAYVPRVRRNGREISCEGGAVRAIMTLRMKLRVRMPLLVRAASCVRHPVRTVRSLKNKSRRGRHG